MRGIKAPMEKEPRSDPASPAWHLIGVPVTTIDYAPPQTLIVYLFSTIQIKTLEILNIGPLKIFRYYLMKVLSEEMMSGISIVCHIKDIHYHLFQARTWTHWYNELQTQTMFSRDVLTCSLEPFSQRFDLELTTMHVGFAAGLSGHMLYTNSCRPGLWPMYYERI